MKIANIDGVNILVEGAYVPTTGFIHYDMQTEPEVFEIHSLSIGDQDVTELLQDKWNEIETVILENYYS